LRLLCSGWLRLHLFLGVLRRRRHIVSSAVHCAGRRVLAWRRCAGGLISGGLIGCVAWSGTGSRVLICRVAGTCLRECRA
jgi:hypothetical protein